MEEKKTYSPIEFERALAGFFGTSNYYEHNITEDIKFLLTDGCNWVRETAKARWLFDEILFYQLRSEIRGLPIQVWVLWEDEDKEDKFWVLRCEDGNDKTVLVQMLMEAVDFPVKEIRIWVVGGIAMLPSEY